MVKFGVLAFQHFQREREQKQQIIQAHYLEITWKVQILQLWDNVPKLVERFIFEKKNGKTPFDIKYRATGKIPQWSFNK